VSNTASAAPIQDTVADCAPPARETHGVNAEALRYAERIAREARHIPAGDGSDSRTVLRAVLDLVFDDHEIRLNFPAAEIRYTAMCGEVAREVFRMIGQSPDMVGLLSIGDVKLPGFARTVVDAIVDAAHAIHNELCAEETYGYDLSSRGSLKARQAMIGYFDRHYAFSQVPGLRGRLAENCASTAGGMRGLDDLATAHVRLAQPDRHARFIYPDNSFATWHSIANLRSVDGKVATVHVLATRPENVLQPTAGDVDEFYDGETLSSAHPTTDLWCITPVGNPSGTRMDACQLAETCRQIVARAPSAKILLDCTYVRTLARPEARALIKGVLERAEILDRIIFLESFSKTHGLCGERCGAYFSANRLLFDEHHSINMTLSAGNGRYKSALALAIAGATEAQEEIIRSLHRFWQRERLGLYHYLVRSRQFGELFADEQGHLRPDQLEATLGLYLFLKLRDGVSGKDVLIRTGCLGVETPMASGNYIRFAVGKITEPTYARFIPVH
jgi:aspartate/methionine/tyrosine aminotransferase